MLSLLITNLLKHVKSFSVLGYEGPQLRATRYARHPITKGPGQNCLYSLGCREDIFSATRCTVKHGIFVAHPRRGPAPRRRVFMFPPRNSASATPSTWFADSSPESALT